MFSILKFWKVNAHLAKHTKRSIKTSNFVFKELELDLDEDTKVLEIKLSREKRLNSLSGVCKIYKQFNDISIK